MEIDGKEEVVVGQRAPIVNDVADFGSITVLYKKAEDILEIVINSSQWPDRVNKEKKHWKWNMAKQRPRWVNGTRLVDQYFHYLEVGVPSKTLPAPPPVEPLSANKRVSPPIETPPIANQLVSRPVETLQIAVHPLAGPAKPVTKLATADTASTLAAQSVQVVQPTKSGPTMGVFRLHSPPRLQQPRPYLSPYAPTYTSPYPSKEPAKPITQPDPKTITTKSTKAVPRRPAGLAASHPSLYTPPPSEPVRVSLMHPTRFNALQTSPKGTPPREPAQGVYTFPVGCFATTAPQDVPYVSPYSSAEPAKVVADPFAKTVTGKPARNAAGRSTKVATRELAKPVIRIPAKSITKKPASFGARSSVKAVTSEIAKPIIRIPAALVAPNPASYVSPYARFNAGEDNVEGTTGGIVEGIAGGDTGSITSASGGIAKGITGPITSGTSRGSVIGSFIVFTGREGPSKRLKSRVTVASDGDPMVLDS
ncbi:hypothetical protein BKA65DRAFT_516975 [Rhexocercosporidium sp. MPI-PUGE-AT-0058]|nr:hypothetical protein BKA65DRAFT_516975 [Rhexocercosporidium sp. MPI-PUGE-AT-0058]